MKRCTRAAATLVVFAWLLTGCSPEDSGARRTPGVSSTSASGTGARGTPAAEAQAPGLPVVLIVDGSGSMTAREGSSTRMDAAKRAAISLVNGLPEGTPVGVLTYGTSTGNSEPEKAAGCRDVTILSPLRPISDDRSKVEAAINGVQGNGYTPMGTAVSKAADLLGSRGGQVVLVSDGIDTCAPPEPEPCSTVRSKVARQSNVTVSIVGFKTDPRATAQLSCMANAGRGLFVTAGNEKQLLSRLRAVRDPSARAHLTSTGIGPAQLGNSHREVAGAVAGFPAWSSARSYAGTLPGVQGALTVIAFRDCQYVFDANRRLVALLPRASTTIDGIGPGASPAELRAAYGAPREVRKNADGTFAALYQADNATRTAYLVTFSADPSQPKAAAAVIVLCICGSQTPAVPTDQIARFDFGNARWIIDNRVAMLKNGEYGPAPSSDGGYVGYRLITDWRSERLSRPRAQDINGDGYLDSVQGVGPTHLPGEWETDHRRFYLWVWDPRRRMAVQAGGKLGGGEYMTFIEAITLQPGRVIVKQKIVIPDTPGEGSARTDIYEWRDGGLALIGR